MDFTAAVCGKRADAVEWEDSSSLRESIRRIPVNAVSADQTEVTRQAAIGSLCFFKADIEYLAGLET